MNPKQLSRREALSLGFAAAVFTAMPATANAVSTAVISAPTVPAWVVGTPGEFDWQHIIAETELEARKIFATEWGCWGEECTHADYTEDCEFCDAIHGIDASRMPAWDGLTDATPADWLRANLGFCCSRCSYETHPDAGARAVGEEAICEDCLTLADWDIIDPGTAAEMRGELEQESA